MSKRLMVDAGWEEKTMVHKYSFIAFSLLRTI